VKEKAPDLTGHAITRLPPGKAFGADALTRWSHKRASGGAGAGAKPMRAIAARGRKPAKGDAK
jgi:hypothetical protein